MLEKKIVALKDSKEAWPYGMSIPDIQNLCKLWKIYLGSNFVEFFSPNH
jgi:hypothetical protein